VACGERRGAEQTESRLGRTENSRRERSRGALGRAAESLEAALQYMRQRYKDFLITGVRFVDMIPLLSGSPLD
jgi:hypothetical protein